MWLKRRTPQNIVIGGASGAFPPMIGWAAVTGDVSLASIPLFLLIFMWTPPHFWALALFRDGDYAKAGVPMLPVVAGQRATKIADADLHAAAVARWRWRLATSAWPARSTARRAVLLGGLFIARGGARAATTTPTAAPARCSAFRCSISSGCSRC